MAEQVNDPIPPPGAAICHVVDATLQLSARARVQADSWALISALNGRPILSPGSAQFPYRQPHAESVPLSPFPPTAGGKAGEAADGF